MTAVIGAALALGGAAYATVRVAPMLFALFLAGVIAVGMRGAARWLSEKTPLGEGPALVLVALLLYGGPVALGVAIGPQLDDQVQQAEQKLPEIQQRADQWLSKVGIGQGGGGQGQGGGGGQAGGGASSAVLKGVGTFVGGVAQGLGGLGLVVVASLYLAASPKRYVDGFLALFPPDRQPRVRELLGETGDKLRAWVLGAIAAMAVAGVATTLGLWALGVQLALLLGVVAGLLDFVPNFGPLIAFVPAALVAAGQGKVLQVAALYAGIQLVQGFVVQPLIEQRSVRTAPVVLLAAQVVLGVLFGFAGVLVAPAILVPIEVLLSRLWVEGTLHEPRDALEGS